MNRLTGKTIVVTAGYGDIGRATCRRCCEENAAVVMTGRKPLAEGQAIALQVQRDAEATIASNRAESCTDTSGTVEYLQCDAASRASIDAMFAEAQTRHPRIDVVIGNAAMVQNSKFLDITAEQWQEHMDLNLTGSFHVGQAAARIMATQEPITRPGIARGVRGKILFNSSWVQDMPWPDGCCYVTSKAGLKLMAQSMAQELAALGIRVNLVAPGIVMAGLSKTEYEKSPEYGPRATAAVPLREFGTADQCAEAFVFLASDDADYITGISLLVDGGASLPRRD